MSIKSKKTSLINKIILNFHIENYKLNNLKKFQQVYISTHND